MAAKPAQTHTSHIDGIDYSGRVELVQYWKRILSKRFESYKTIDKTSHEPTTLPDKLTRLSSARL